MDWVEYLGSNCKRHNTLVDEAFRSYVYKDAIVQDFKEEASTRQDPRSEDTFEPDAIWFRCTPVSTPNSLDGLSVSEDNLKILKSFLAKEQSRYLRGLLIKYGDKVKLGKGIAQIVCKLTNLKRAQEVGIDIPITLITKFKDEVVRFKQQCGKIITKPLGEMPYFNHEIDGESTIATAYTEEVTEHVLEGMPNSFYPSLFQEKLDKELELRIFFLNGICYSMAIFSQLDQQTAVDFRMYNTEKGNRSIPYTIPEEFSHKIKSLMDSLNYNMGSLDVIKTKEGKYVFLEINPYGQFGMTSVPCNYYLDEKIAKFLIDETE